MKILVVCLGGIGDIVLSTPVLRVLKQQLAACEIHFLCKPDVEQILEANPYLTKMHTLGINQGELLDQLKNEAFEILVDLSYDSSSVGIKRQLKINTYNVDSLNVYQWLAVNFKVNRLPNRHVVDRYIDTIKPLGVDMDDGGLDYFIPDKDVVEDDWLPETHRKDMVVFAIGTKHKTKQLPVDKMIELCDRINKPVILLGDKGDSAIGNEIEDFFLRRQEHQSYEKGLKDLNKKTLVFNGCGKFNLNQSASVIEKSIAVFTHDSGLMQIAAAFNKHVFSIWGSSVPEFGTYPYRTKFTVFQNTKAHCRPCSVAGEDKCPVGHFNCMNNIAFDFYLP